MKMTISFLLLALVIMMRPMLALAEDIKVDVSPNHAVTENQKNISTDTEDSDDPITIKNGDEQVHINVGKFKGPEDIVVPIAFFIFLLALFLGRRHFIEKTNQRKIELLEKMVEKGQPVSDAIIQQVFSEDRSRRFGNTSIARTVRRGVAFTAIGAGLLLYSLLMHQTGGKLIVAIVLLGLGIGSLVSHRFEKKEANSSENK